jgi:squalene cyclase
VTGEDYVYRLFGLLWTDAKSNQIATAARELVAQQRTDGGWAQTSEMQPDAYASGLALSALAIADPTSVNTAAYRRGVNYLMRSREADGSWHVKTRAFGFQPYFESGFPHGQDQWISMAATAWSAMALMPVAGAAEVASR